MEVEEREEPEPRVGDDVAGGQEAIKPPDHPPRPDVLGEGIERGGAAVREPLKWVLGLPPFIMKL